MKKILDWFFKSKHISPEIEITLSDNAYDKVDNQLELVFLRVIGQSEPGTFIGATVWFLHGDPINVTFRKNLNIPDSWQIPLKKFAKEHLQELRKIKMY